MKFKKYLYELSVEINSSYLENRYSSYFFKVIVSVKSRTVFD